MVRYPTVRRKLWAFENPGLKIEVAPGGGHIAALHLKNGHPKAKSLPNPLWTPPWESIEPNAYQPKKHDRTYGGAPEGRLLASILGHNLALDSFGAPSDPEIKAGGITHGEAGVVLWKRHGKNGVSARLPIAQLDVSREIKFHPKLPIALVHTVVRNLSRQDRPLIWAEHVSFGPPFLTPQTEFVLPARRAMVYPADFGPDGTLEPGREFVWPQAPVRDWKPPAPGHQDMQYIPKAKRATSFTAQLFDTPSDLAWFTATNPKLDLTVGYLFRRSDFPWIGIWDEKLSRSTPPWNRRTLARGMEFSTTPFPTSRRAIISQGKMFGEPVYRWLDALGEIQSDFVIFAGPTSAADLHDEALRVLNTGK